MSTADWDNEYARVAKAAGQILDTSSSSSSNYQVSSLRNDLDRLMSALNGMGGMLSPAEAGRRRKLVQHLQRQLPPPPETSSSLLLSGGGNGVGGSSYDPPLSSSSGGSQLSMAMQQQDVMIDQLSLGVGRLRDNAGLINDEARMHVRLIDGMDDDVERATSSLEAETRRANKLREDARVCRLYMIIGALTVLLVLLILLGLS